MFSALDLSNPDNLQKYLSDVHPRWTCTNLTKLSGGTANLTCRGTFANGGTVVVKHAENLAGRGWSIPASRAFDEQLVLSQLHGSLHRLQGESGVVVNTPGVLAYLDDSFTQIIEHAKDTMDLKSFLLKQSMSDEVAREVGMALGRWTKSFHEWGRAPAQSQLREILRRNNNVRFKHNINYGRLEASLARFPQELESLKAQMSALAKFPEHEDQSEVGVIHGDFWCGNILLPASLLDLTNSQLPLALWIIDWEMVQVSSPAYDVGQLFAELYLLFVFMAREEAVTIIEAFLRAYGAVREDVAFRVVVHFGVHLIVWPQYIPDWQDMAKLQACASYAVECIQAASRRDSVFFEGGSLAGLFRGQGSAPQAEAHTSRR